MRGHEGTRRGSRRAHAAVALVLAATLLPAPGGAMPAGASTTAAYAAAALRAPLPDRVPNQAIVRFHARATSRARFRALARAGATTLRSLSLPRAVLVRVPADAAIGALARDGSVEFAEPVLRLRVQSMGTNDPCANRERSSSCPSRSWHLDAIAAQSGWARFPGVFYSPANPKSSIAPASRVKVAVIDTAIRRGHTDFKNGYTSDDLALGGQLDVAGMNAFTQGLPEHMGSHRYHGTYVAGLLAASANNAYGTAGVGYNADLLPLAAVHGASGAADSTLVGDAILHAHARGSRVITLALGLTSPSAYVNESIQNVVQAPNPALVVAAAGNNTGDQPFYPAWFDNVLAVGGVDEADRRAPCANFGPKLSVVAPSTDIQSLSHDPPPDMLATQCGTSAATPQVAGLAAMLFAQDPSRTPEQVRFVIERTADDLGAPGRDDQFGFGRINVERALTFGQPLAHTDSVAAPPARNGGTAFVTARSTSNAPIVGAELFVGRQPTGPSDRGFALSPEDGSWGGYAEDVRIAYAVGGLANGGHRIFVRTLDATGVWGPLATGAFYVDGYAPTVAAQRATDVIRPLDAGSTITFDARDEWSRTITYTVEVRNTLTQQVAWRSNRTTAPVGEQSITWYPATTDPPGRYAVAITVRDEAGNAATAGASTLVI